MFGWLWLGLALAKDPPSETVTVYGDLWGEPEEVTIYGDLFARWDGTRWWIRTEIGMPFPLTLPYAENLEFKTSMMQIETVLACEKEWRLGQHRYEVDCHLEDFAMRATHWVPRKGDDYDALKLAQTKENKKARKELEEKGANLPLGGERESVHYTELKATKQDLPKYPEKLYKLEFTDNRCIVQADVEADGHVSKAYVTACEDAFVEHALNEVESWEFEAPGRPVRTAFVVDFDQASRVSKILDQLKERLSSARLQLQVTDDGRVVNVDLEGVVKDREREEEQYDLLRLVLNRLVLGFDMKLRQFNNLSEGQWVEYNTPLMGVPTPEGVSSRGASMLVHQLNKYRGHRVVQSVGKGSAAFGEDELGVTFIVKFNGVSIYDEGEGFMTERVWSMQGTASSAEALADRPYWTAGRIRMLGEDEHPELGFTGRVEFPGEHTSDAIPDWMPLDQ